MDDFLQAEAAEIGETHPYREAAKLTLGSAISVEMVNGAALLNANGVTVLFCPPVYRRRICRRRGARPILQCWHRMLRESKRNIRCCPWTSRMWVMRLPEDNR